MSGPTGTGTGTAFCAVAPTRQVTGRTCRGRLPISPSTVFARSEPKRQFLEPRAKGWSLRRIAEHLQIAQRTLVDWNRQEHKEIRKVCLAPPVVEDVIPYEEMSS